MKTNALLFLTPQAVKKFESLPYIHFFSMPDYPDHPFFLVSDIKFEAYGLWIEIEVVRPDGEDTWQGKAYLLYSDILTIWDRRGYTKETEPEKVFGFQLTKTEKEK